jgi:hypothetical protein
VKLLKNLTARKPTNPTQSQTKKQPAPSHKPNCSHPARKLTLHHNVFIFKKSLVEAFKVN